jgi:hypothetical protein
MSASLARAKAPEFTTDAVLPSGDFGKVSLKELTAGGKCVPHRALMGPHCVISRTPLTAPLLFAPSPPPRAGTSSSCSTRRTSRLMSRNTPRRIARPPSPPAQCFPPAIPRAPFRPPPPRGTACARRRPKARSLWRTALSARRDAPRGPRARRPRQEARGADRRSGRVAIQPLTPGPSPHLPLLPSPAPPEPRR